MVGIATRKTEEDVASLTSLEEDESVFTADTDTPSISKTRSNKQYLKLYGQLMASSFSTSEGDSQAVFEAARGQTEEASLFQSSSKS